MDTAENNYQIDGDINNFFQVKNLYSPRSKERFTYYIMNHFFPTRQMVSIGEVRRESVSAM